MKGRASMSTSKVPSEVVAVSFPGVFEKENRSSLLAGMSGVSGGAMTVACIWV